MGGEGGVISHTILKKRNLVPRTLREITRHGKVVLMPKSEVGVTVQTVEES